MATINITVQNTEARQKLDRLAKAIGPRPILNVIGLRLMSFVDESFKTRGRGKWPPLAWSTVALRRRGGSAPLQDTGRYKQSFVKETDDRTYVEVGTNLRTPSGAVLAAIHENGTGPYTIRVKRARVLAAQVGAAGVQSISGRGQMGWMVFGKEVHHPGVPARPVLPDRATTERLVIDSVSEMLKTETDRGGR